MILELLSVYFNSVICVLNVIKVLIVSNNLYFDKDFVWEVFIQMSDCFKQGNVVKGFGYIILSFLPLKLFVEFCFFLKHLKRLKNKSKKSMRKVVFVSLFVFLFSYKDFFLFVVLLDGSILNIIYKSMVISSFLLFLYLFVWIKLN